MGLKADLANVRTEHNEEKEAIREAAEDERLAEVASSWLLGRLGLRHGSSWRGVAWLGLTCLAWLGFCLAFSWVGLAWLGLAFSWLFLGLFLAFLGFFFLEWLGLSRMLIFPLLPFPCMCVCMLVYVRVCVC